MNFQVVQILNPSNTYISKTDINNIISSRKTERFMPRGSVAKF